MDLGENKWILVYSMYIRTGKVKFAKHGLGERVEKGGSVEWEVIKLGELLRSQGIIRCCRCVGRVMSVFISVCENEAHDNS